MNTKLWHVSLFAPRNGTLRWFLLAIKRSGSTTMCTRRSYQRLRTFGLLNGVVFAQLSSCVGRTTSQKKKQLYLLMGPPEGPDVPVRDTKEFATGSYDQLIVNCQFGSNKCPLGYMTFPFWPASVGLRWLRLLFLLAATKQKQLPNIWSSIWTVTRVVIRWWASGIFLWFFYELQLISRVPVFLWTNKIFIHFFFFFFFWRFSWSRVCGWWHETLSEGAASWLIRNKWLGSITSIKCHPRGSVRFQLTSNQWKCL